MKEGVVMSKLDVKTKSAGVKFDDIKAQMMEDAEFHEEYDKLQPRYELISQIIEARKRIQKESSEDLQTKRKKNLKHIRHSISAVVCLIMTQMMNLTKTDIKRLYRPPSKTILKPTAMRMRKKSRMTTC